MELPSGIPGDFTLGGGMRVDQKDNGYYLVEYTDYVNPKFNTSKVMRELTQREAVEMITHLEFAKRWVWSKDDGIKNSMAMASGKKGRDVELRQWMHESFARLRQLLRRILPQAFPK